MVEVIEHYRNTHAGIYVESVKILKVDSTEYQSGWKYSLHYGTLDGDTLLRYDNAHEQSKGHERHTQDGVKQIDFPGMFVLFERFQAEIETFPQNQ